MATKDEAKAMAIRLREQCDKAITFSKTYGKQDGRDAVVTLRLKGHSKAEQRRLWGRGGGPMGRIVGSERDWQVVMFDAHDVLDAVAKLERAANDGE